MDKSPDAFRTISEVAEVLDTPAHVLRFWETRFPQIRPVKRAGGRRYYRPSDVALLSGIRRLLHDEGLTIRGVQKILRDHGVRHVAGLSDDSVPVGPTGAGISPDIAAADSATTGDGALEPPFDPHFDSPFNVASFDTSAPDQVPEAGFIAIEDDMPPDAGAPAFAPPPRGAPVQPPLPLFEAAAAPRPALRDDVTLASLIRALPRGQLGPAKAEVAALSRRLSALRATLAERAEGGAG